MADLSYIDATQEVKVVGQDATGNRANYVGADANGNMMVIAELTDNVVPTYSASAVGITIAAAATDVFIIQGSATKTIKILRVEFSVTTTGGSGVFYNASLIKRSAANTGGTSAAQTNTPHDSNNSAATAVVSSYTANPTALGASVGTIRALRASAFNANASPEYTTWDFGLRPGQSIYLRGTSQYLAVNFGGATIAGGIMSVSIEWTEQ